LTRQSRRGKAQRLTSSLFCLAALLAAGTSRGGELPRPPADYFGEYSGCALVVTRDRHHETRFEFGGAQCALPLSPCSTFKIPNALISLQSGVVDGPGHLKTWDGTVHERAVNNRDHTLASAMQHSVVWYFQSLARDVGAQRMQTWLDRLNYGNRDISGGIDRFWLGSSLEISAYRQLELIKELDHQTLPFSHAVQQQVTDMLQQASALAGTLYGKTGSCRGDSHSRPDHGWFIGWVDWASSTARNPVTSYFVVNIRGQGAWGVNARPIALALLNDLQQ